MTATTDLVPRPRRPSLIGTTGAHRRGGARPQRRTAHQARRSPIPQAGSRRPVRHRARCHVEPGHRRRLSHHRAPGAGRRPLRRAPPLRPPADRQLTARSSDDEIDWDDLLDGPRSPPPSSCATSTTLIASIQDPHLAALMTALLGARTTTGQAFRRAPAAKYNHHAYRRGLLEHSVDIAHSSARPRVVFGASTATSPSAARCCTTSASSTPTPASTAAPT